MGKIAKSDKPYERRQIVAKMGRAGYFTVEGKKYILWQYMTFWCGYNVPTICAKFDRICDMDKQGFIRLDRVNEGELLVKPGLIYKIVPMTGEIMAEHLRGMVSFKPKPVYSFEKSKEAAFDLGTINMEQK